MSDKLGLTSGWDPVAGNWYPEIVLPTPPVYFEYARNEIIASLYPDLVVESCTSVADIATAITNAEDNIAEVKITADFEQELTSTGKIRTIAIPTGKTLIVDLNGHTIKNVAYLFYVNGGTLIINDSKGTGKMICTDKSESCYPAIYVSGSTASVTMNAGTLQTYPDDIADGEVCYTYGIYAANQSSVYLGGTAAIKSYQAACVSTNGSATSGSGNFYISGNAALEVIASSFSLYMPNQQDAVITGNATLIGGICARQGQFTISGNAKITNSAEFTTDQDIYDFLSVSSGYTEANNAIVLVLGTYTSTNEEYGNSFNMTITDNAVVETSADTEAIAVGLFDTAYDQTATLTVKSADNTSGVVVLGHDEISAAATERSYSYTAKTTTDFTYTLAGEQIYPTE